MPELRKDPIVDRWVVIAPDRARRPIDIINDPQASDNTFDPFAEGNEGATPHELLAYRKAGTVANGPGWRVRVVPNKFPAFQLEGNLDQHGDGLYQSMNGIGAHEVVIECPYFETNLSRLSVENIREVLGVYRDRLVDLKQDRRLLHALIFKNKGPLAGASLHHSHSQIIATPVVPISIREKIDGALKYFHDFNHSIFEDMIQQELATGSRIVHDSSNFLAFCPYASRFPFEIWIIPKQHSSHFENIRQQPINDLGHVLKTVLRKLEATLHDPAYNYVIHTAPFNQPELPHFTWHMEIFPRSTRIAGYEFGSGFSINHVSPEDAARFLRDADDA